MEKKEEPAKVVKPTYNELPPQYKPYEPSKLQQRLLERFLRKKR